MELLHKHIDRLSQEATKLAYEKSQHEKHIRDIDIRLHQIVGAIAELDKIIKELPVDSIAK